MRDVNVHGRASDLRQAAAIIGYELGEIIEVVFVGGSSVAVVLTGEPLSAR